MGIWVYNNRAERGRKTILYSWLFLLSCSLLIGAIFWEETNEISHIGMAIIWASPILLTGPFLLSALKFKWNEIWVYLAILMLSPIGFYGAFLSLLFSNQIWRL